MHIDNRGVCVCCFVHSDRQITGYRGQILHLTPPAQEVRHYQGIDQSYKNEDLGRRRRSLSLMSETIPTCKYVCDRSFQLQESVLFSNQFSFVATPCRISCRSYKLA